MHAQESYGNPYFDVSLQLESTRPDQSTVLVEGFYDGERTFKARAYCDTTGTWRERPRISDPQSCGANG